ncbi:hypothetical protein AWL63_23170 (plasmid) [Sphingomonas panacis]|uniref:histidine kinase n=1 Tax=Sphingomonas panacis TaxID=1560345 RepID=A0A1B3ZI33_9SPHN|nr:HWE histidine kinase domain-containing protein [Sphingomonas panacis]AOH87087.1 hypothetical protein AWL63_23170 [Sphingomonas panacis]
MEVMHDLDSASLGAVLKTALDAVVVMRMDGTIAGWNDVAARTFGWSYDEAYGQRMSEMIIPPRYRAAHEQGLGHFLATGAGPVLDRHFEIEALHRAGYELPVELSITRTEQFGAPVFLGFLRDISERRDAARRQELMIGELNHRVKNLLGVVAAIAHQTGRNATTLPEFSKAFEGRLASLARSHEILTSVAWERAPLRALVDELFGADLSEAAPRITVDGPTVLLAPRHLLSLSMILHELMTNAVKYGALSTPGGQINLTWAVKDGELSLIWSETGISGVQTPSRKGFGSKMIALSVKHELRGTMNKDWREDGMRFYLSFALAEEAA